MNGYDVEDEYDVAQGIRDALTTRLKDQTGREWLGWQIDEACLGEIEIEASGKKFRVIVEPVEG